MDYLGILSLVLCIILSSALSVPLKSQKTSSSNKTAWENPIRPPIRFNPDGTLKIVHFADLHYGEFPGIELGPQNDNKTTEALRTILEYETPDFVIFTGDQVTGDNMQGNESSYIEMILGPLVESNYRWATTYGNHDTGPNVTRERILSTEQKYDLCYTQHGPAELLGVTNYFLPIFPAEGEEPSMIWWFFDSRGGRTVNGSVPEIVDELVIDWFRAENAKIQAALGPIPSLAYFHIPTIDFRAVQLDVFTNPLCAGMVGELVFPQDRNTTLLDALIEAGTTSAFVGHDHGNSWCCFYKTLELCYNRHTGYGGYGLWNRGARVIVLDLESGQRANYIRMENGNIISPFPNEGDEGQSTEQEI